VSFFQRTGAVLPFRERDLEKRLQARQHMNHWKGTTDGISHVMVMVKQLMLARKNKTKNREIKFSRLFMKPELPAVVTQEVYTSDEHIICQSVERAMKDDLHNMRYYLWWDGEVGYQTQGHIYKNNPIIMRWSVCEFD
jgi:hypothetical protein